MTWPRGVSGHPLHRPEPATFPCTVPRRCLAGLPALVTLLSLVVASTALAGEPSRQSAARAGAEPSWRPLTVAILPLLELGLLEGAPFDQPAPEGVLHVRALARRRAEVTSELTTLAGSLDLVRVLDEEQLRAAVGGMPALSGQALVANERLALGRERWLGLDAADALAQFEVADRLMQAAFIDLLAPERYAELALWRGLALIELGRAAEARAAFQIMFLHDPGRRFSPGWYGHAVEGLMRAAAEDLRALPAPEDLRFPDARVARLAEALASTTAPGAASVHWLGAVLHAPHGGGVAGSDPSPPADQVDPAPATPAVPVDPSAPASLLTLDLRAHGEETAPSSRRITLPLAPPAALPSTPLASYPTTRGALSPATREAISRWLHAWHPCALARDDGHPLRWQAAPPPALHLSLAYRHGLWLHHRQTRLGLHGPGVALTAAWEPSGRLQLWGRFAQVTTLTDARGDLLAQFGATHLGLGAGLRVGDAALSLSLRFGLAAALTLNDFEATTDIDCKFFGPASARCGDIFVARAPLAWFGVTSGLALRWNPEPGWHVAGEVSLDAFVGAPSAVRELNYPLAFLLGFGASL